MVVTVVAIIWQMDYYVLYLFVLNREHFLLTKRVWLNSDLSLKSQLSSWAGSLAKDLLLQKNTM